MRLVFLGLVVGVILGVGVGSTLFSPDPVAHQPLPSVEPAAPRPIESPGLAELPQIRPDSSRDAAPKLDVGEAPAFSDSELDEAIRSTPTKPREQEVGPGVIRGRVLDTEGRPIAGVLVRATRRRERGPSASDPSQIGVMPQKPSLERHLRNAAKEYAAGRSRSFEATSNASGEFALTGLQEGRYSLSPYAEGYLLRKKGGRVGYVPIDEIWHEIDEAHTGDEIEFIGVAILDVPVSVHLADGTEVEHAIVRCADRPIGSGESWGQNLFGHGKSEFTWSPSSPRLRLPARTIYLRAFANPSSSDPAFDTNEVDFRSKSVEVVLEPGTNPPTVILSLESRSGIRGRVIFPAERLQDTMPVVHLMALAAGGEVNFEALPDSTHEVTLHGGEDQFSFLDLLPGRYAVGVNRDWNAPIEVHGVFDVGAGVIQCELRLPPPDMDQFIHVTVLRPDGGIADGVLFGFTHRSGGGRPSRTGSAPMRTQEGVYLYSVPVNSKNAYYVDPSAVDEFLISARADGYGELEVPLTPGQREITIQLVGEAILEVSVLGIAGSSLHGQFQVSVKPILEGGMEGSSSPFGKEVSSQGMVRYDGLAAQRHRVTLSTKFRRGTPGNHMQSSELMTTDVLLHSGTNLLEITAPPVYTLEVLVEGTQEIRNIYLWRASPETGEIMESVGSQNTDELGRASFDLLPAGQYALRGLTVAEEVEAVTVPCGPVTLRAK